MSIALSAVLQRVFVRDPKTGENIWLPERVHAVLRVVFDQVLDQDPERPINLFVQEIGRRCRKSVRTVQTALKEAEALGLIKRIRINAGRLEHGAAPARQINSTWPILVHAAAIQASKNKHPHHGPDLKKPIAQLVYPQPWSGTETFGGAIFAGASFAGKKGEEKKTTPPRRKLSAVPRAKPCPPERARGQGFKAAGVGHLALPSAACGRGGSGDSKLIVDFGVVEQMNLNQDHMPMLGWAGRAASVVNLADFVQRGRQKFSEPEPMAREPQDNRYWGWLRASAAAAGWAEKQEGQWAGSRPGDLRFVLQERKKTTGERGATLLPLVVTLSKVAAGAEAALKNAAREQKRGRKVEAVFQPVGETPLLLIDDLKPEHVQLFSGWRGVAIFETSPGNLQASLMAPRPLKSWEALAAHRALARRCGLSLAAVSATHFRRFEGSVNNKKALSEPFTTRLFCEPVDGTLTAAQLADLLAEDAAHIASPATKTAAVSAQKTEFVAPAFAAKKARSVSGPDNSASADDWHWLMLRMNRVGGQDRDRLIAALVDRAGARLRQGKRTDNKDHLRYAEWTVDRAIARRAAKKAAGGG